MNPSAQQRIKPCLWFDIPANEASAFYCDIFPDSKQLVKSPMVSGFSIAGFTFNCLNGGPLFRPNPSISFYIICADEAEIDRCWAALLDDGESLMPLGEYDWAKKYGWVQDRYGVSWQLAWSDLEDVGQVVTPSLLFTQYYCGQAEEAMNHYMAIFGEGTIDGVMKYEDDPKLIQHAQFSMAGSKFMMMDGPGDHPFSFNEGISLMVNCEDQAEIDYYWQQLSAGGEEGRCGWLKDAFGVSWQVVPTELGRLMSDPERSKRVSQAFMKMNKINLDELRNA